MTATLRSAMKEARAHARLGWYQTGPLSGYMRCPRCRHECHTQWEAAASAQVAQRVRIAALAEHLIDVHP